MQKDKGWKAARLFCLGVLAYGLDLYKFYPARAFAPGHFPQGREQFGQCKNYLYKLYLARAFPPGHFPQGREHIWSVQE